MSRARTHIAQMLVVGMGLLACQSSPARQMPRAGPARTPEEVAQCVREQKARIVLQPIPIELGDKPVGLRSTPVDLPDDGCEKATRKWNFAQNQSEKGCFVNVFLEVIHYRESEITEVPDVVTDLATGLMWANVSSERLRFKSIDDLMKRTNEDNYRGHSDWRLPTTEEFLSIMNLYGEYHFDAWLFHPMRDCWTSDYKSGGKVRWMLDAGDIKCSAEDSEEKSAEHKVYAVRTMSKQEWEDGRRKYEKWKASVKRN